MDKSEKKEKIKALVEELLNDSQENMITKIDKALNSGAIDVDLWDENNLSMYLPRVITMAILQNEALRYNGKGTSFERRIKKEADNIGYFI